MWEMLEEDASIVFMSGFCPTFALTYVLLIPLMTDFNAVTRTHCYRAVNYLPSVSAAIGYSFQTTVIWFLCILIHTPYRFKLAKLLNNCYKKVRGSVYTSECLLSLSVNEIRRYKQTENLVKYSLWFNKLEIIGLVVLSVFSSNGNYDMHKNGFGMYLIGSSGFTICVCLIELDLQRKNLFNSYKIRIRLAIVYFTSFFLSIGLFYWHNVYCTSYVYTFFGFFEVVLILSNIAFHTYPSYLIITNSNKNLLIVWYVFSLYRIKLI